MVAGKSLCFAGAICGVASLEKCILHLRFEKLSRQSQGTGSQSVQYCLPDGSAGSCFGAVSQAGIARVRRVYSVLWAPWTIAWHAIRGRVYRRRRPAYFGLAQRRANRAADLLRRLDSGDIAKLCSREES